VFQAQEISLNYHCKCEQYAHFSSGSFFNFNGTAGVWRVRAIIDVGGWNSRTTVEDMDLSLRAYLAGWKGMYLRDVTCLNEVNTCLAKYALFCDCACALPGTSREPHRCIISSRGKASTSDLLIIILINIVCGHQ